MTKKLVISFIVLCAAIMLFGSPTQLLSEKPNTIELLDNSFNSITINYELKSLELEDIRTTEGTFTQVVAPNIGHSGFIGEPQLPCVTKIISVPVGATLEVKVNNQMTELFSLTKNGHSNPIFPAQPSVSKSSKKEDIEFVMNKQLYKEETYSHKIIETTEIGFMRGYRLFEVTYYPVTYNISEKTIEVVTSSEIQVNFVGSDYMATENLKAKTYSSAYEGVFQNTLFNYSRTRSTLENYPLGYVIVTPSMFLDTLEPFITWKTEQGYDVTILTTEAVGTTTTGIKSAINNLWTSATVDSPAPSYLLLVGDVAQVPAYAGQTNSGHITDLDYVKLEGTDYLPEMYYGRFSATSVSQLLTIVNKTLMYEKFEMSDPSYLERATLIAGVDASWAPTHGNGTINYGSQYYFNSAHDVDATTYLYPASGSSESSIAADINAGVGYLNYTAHGSQTSWADPSMGISDVNGFTNDEMYPVVVGNCCLTNHFDTDTSFGEAWLRAENGAVIYIGGNNNTLWDEDYWWSVGHFTPTSTANPTYSGTGVGMFDALFHDNDEDFSDWINTAGSMVYTGNMAVQSSSSSDKNYYWEIYSIMGDPSLMPYIGIPEVQTPNYTSTLLVGTSSLAVNAAPYSYVSLTRDGDILATALANGSGTANLTFSALDTTQSLKLVISHTDYRPSINTIEVIPAEGPFLSIESYTFNTSDNDSVVELGETCSVNLTINNSGVEIAPAGVITFSESSAFLTLNSTSATVQSVTAGNSITLNSVCSFAVSSNIPNGTSQSINYTITSGNDTYNGSISFTVKSYNVALGNVTIDDTGAGNGNSIIDVSEEFNFVVSASNNGETSSPAQSMSISSVSDITLPTTFTIPAIPAGNTIEFNIPATSASSLSDGQEVTFSCSVTYPNGSSNTSAIFIASLLIIGEGTETDIHLPFEPYYGFTYSQSIYTAEDLNLSSCMIDKVSFYWNGNSAFTDDIAVFMANTSTDAFAATTGWIGYSELSEVYSGDFTVPASEGWVELILQTPFIYNGTDNIVIGFDENTDGYHGSSDEFIGHTTGTNQSIYYYNDSTNPDPSSPPTGTLSSKRPNIRVYTSEATDDPNIVVSEVSLDFGEIIIGSSKTLSFDVRNTGNSTLVGDVTLPSGFSFASRNRNKSYTTTRNTTVNYSLEASEAITYDIMFEPTIELCYDNNVTISHNAEGESRYVSLVACGIKPTYSANTRAFTKTMQADELSTESLIITNTGSGDLELVLDISDVSRNSGGPDTYGYTWSDSDESSVDYDWIDISASGTVVSEGDDDSEEIALPFSFTYYGESYNSVYACSNGFLNFIDDTTSYNNASMPNSAEPNGIIAPYWDDLKPTGGEWGNVYYQNFTDYSVIQWNDVSQYNSSTPTENSTFQVILYSSGNIKLQYKTLGTQTDYSVGIEDHLGGDGLLIGYNQDVLSEEYAILFSTTGTPEWLTIDTTEATIPEGESITVELSFNTTNYINGLYQKVIDIATNDPDNELIEIPVNLTVGTSTLPQIGVSVTSIDMGTIFVNDVAVEEFTISNSGVATLNATINSSIGFLIEEQSRASKSKDYFLTRKIASKNVLRSLDVAIASGSTKTFTCSHSTVNTGTISGSISIASDAENYPNINIPVSLTVINPANIELDIADISLTLRANEQETSNVTITNSGDVALECNLSLSFPTTREDNEVFSANFDDDTLADWTIISDDASGAEWAIVDDRGGEDIGSGSFLLIDSDAAGSGFTQDETAETPLINVAGVESITIVFDQYFNAINEEIADVDFWNGTDWINLIQYTGSDIGSWTTANHFSHTIENDGFTNIKFRFHYYDASYAWYWAIDNLVVTTSGVAAPEWVVLNNEFSAITVAANSSEEFSLEFDSSTFEDGTYSASLDIQSNANNSSNLNIPITLIIQEAVNNPNWEAVVYPNNSATLYGMVELNGTSASSGDIISAFVGNECRAVGTIIEANGNAYTTLLVQCSTSDENVSFKLYDESEDVVIELSNVTTINSGVTIGSSISPFLIEIGEEVLIAPNNVSIDLVGANANLSWNAVPFATSYVVEFSNNLTDWSQVTTTTETSFTVAQPRTSTQSFFYRIKARK